MPSGRSRSPSGARWEASAGGAAYRIIWGVLAAVMGFLGAIAREARGRTRGALAQSGRP
jgi:hypothetical protein